MNPAGASCSRQRPSAPSPRAADSPWRRTRSPGPPALPQVKPEDIGIDPKRLQVAYDLMEKWTTGPKAPVPGGAILVGRAGKAVAPRFFGRQGPEADAEPIRRDAMFYMASVTKPVIYTGGDAPGRARPAQPQRPGHALRPRVHAARARRTAQVLHLFTHTSGLPDELPNNAELRQAARAAEEVHRGGDQGRPAVQARHAAQLLQLGHHPRRRDRPAAVGAVHPGVRAPEIIEPLGLKSTGLGSQGFAARAAGAGDGARLPGRHGRRLEQQVLAGVRLAGRRAVQHARRTSPSSAP